MNNSDSYTQQNSGGVNFQNNNSGGQINQSAGDMTVNNSDIPSPSGVDMRKAIVGVFFLDSICSTLMLFLLSPGHNPITSVLEAVGFDTASTASASALPLPIAVISLVAIPPTKLEAPNRFQNPAHN